MTDIDSRPWCPSGWKNARSFCFNHYFLSYLQSYATALSVWLSFSLLQGTCPSQRGLPSTFPPALSSPKVYFYPCHCPQTALTQSVILFPFLDPVLGKGNDLLWMLPSREMKESPNLWCFKKANVTGRSASCLSTTEEFTSITPSSWWIIRWWFGE